MLSLGFLRNSSQSNTGIGFGLFISRRITEAHGGRIWTENNNDDKGATFSFSLTLSTKIEIQ